VRTILEHLSFPKTKKPMRNTRATQKPHHYSKGKRKKQRPIQPNETRKPEQKKRKNMGKGQRKRQIVLLFIKRIMQKQICMCINIYIYIYGAYASSL
jgi:hypothetical protein